MRVYVVVILEPSRELLHDGDGIWPWVYAGIIAFQCFDEGLAYAVAFRASDRREARSKVQGGCEVDGLSGGIGGAIINQPAMREWLTNEGVPPRPGPPEAFMAEMTPATEDLRKLLREANIKVE
jgi:hypothetical protein